MDMLKDFRASGKTLELVNLSRVYHKVCPLTDNSKVCKEKVQELINQQIRGLVEMGDTDK